MLLVCRLIEFVLLSKPDTPDSTWSATTSAGEEWSFFGTSAGRDGKLNQGTVKEKKCNQSDFFPIPMSAAGDPCPFRKIEQICTLDFYFFPGGGGGFGYNAPAVICKLILLIPYCIAEVRLLYAEMNICKLDARNSFLCSNDYFILNPVYSEF